jgi:salicylate hydroxylase
MNIYGPYAHFVLYPVSPTKIAWAVTQRDLKETKETWSKFTADEIPIAKERLREELKDWCDPVPDLIDGLYRGLKYGIYDRPQLEPDFWHSRRCVILGDAAHPTSPHLGQGANQAM